MTPRAVSVFRKRKVMFIPWERLLRSLRARWRWVRGRCPRCNRNLYATFPYYMAAYPDCPVCKDETETDVRVWRKHRTLGTAQRPEVVGVPEEYGQERG